MLIDLPTEMKRRDWLSYATQGLAGIALTALDQHESAGGPRHAAIGLHHAPRAKRVIQLFMAGAASHVDTFDYKPLLQKQHGPPWDPGEQVELFQSTPGACMQSPWKFRAYGNSGKPLSEIVAPLGKWLTSWHSFTTWSARQAFIAKARCCKPLGSTCQASPASVLGFRMDWAVRTITCQRLL